MAHISYAPRLKRQCSTCRACVSCFALITRISFTPPHLSPEIPPHSRLKVPRPLSKRTSKKPQIIVIPVSIYSTWPSHTKPPPPHPNNRLERTASKVKQRVQQHHSPIVGAQEQQSRPPKSMTTTRTTLPKAKLKTDTSCQQTYQQGIGNQENELIRSSWCGLWDSSSRMGFRRR
ncbi:hypothetical protein BCR34DRAFT_236900 [Clohesyomyces aquaticus]|uniref:Uncharacterized protein n=1 Tax=Clohesyomyces aquaticus TaxID=1231657 RepID=A0A1Y1ZW11_9PLEO|nr:hypothetical protein BCR34DRAFT_236900 [Clohesyomyces aquaticus]